MKNQAGGQSGSARSASGPSTSGTWWRCTRRSGRRSSDYAVVLEWFGHAQRLPPHERVSRRPAEHSISKSTTFCISSTSMSRPRARGRGASKSFSGEIPPSGPNQSTPCLDCHLEFPPSMLPQSMSPSTFHFPGLFHMVPCAPHMVGKIRPRNG